MLKAKGTKRTTLGAAAIVALGAFGLASLAVGDVASAAPAVTLPNARGYELVSEVEGPEVYPPQGSQLEAEEPDLVTEQPARASVRGDAVTYIADPPDVGGNGSSGLGSGNQYYAARTANGWSSTDITPPATPIGATGYESFARDLSLSIMQSSVQPLLNAEPMGVAGCEDLYARTPDGALHALFTTTQTEGLCGEPTFVGGAEDGSHLVFDTAAALLPEAEEASGGEHANVYDSAHGKLALVNVLPGEEPDPNATTGGPSGTRNPPALSNAVSADGTRIYWTDLGSGRVYLREKAVTRKAVTRAVSTGAGKFWTASRDGRFAFYIEGGVLWRFDAGSGPGGERTVLAAPGAAEVGVQGVVGASDDGDYVYFVAGAALAPGATAGSCKLAELIEGGGEEEERSAKEVEQEALGHFEGRRCNLYFLHVGGDPKYVAALAPSDNQLPQFGGTQFGDWQPDLGSRTAQVTPDGQHLVFESRQRLTGYDNGGAAFVQPAIEIFRYDATRATSPSNPNCVSCNPSGNPPVNEGQEGNGTFLPVSSNKTYMRRWLSEDGRRVFFDSTQPLASQDSNGTQDVYQWEAEGTTDCPEVSTLNDNGCLSLLSGGDSPDRSHFLDASADGSNVFFTTRDKLVQADGDEKMSLYDARIGGGAPQITDPCAAGQCVGVPEPPPTFPAPATGTLVGLGNVTPPTPTPPKPKTAAQIRAQKLAKALKACHAKHDKHKRQTCERQARKRYGLAKAKKASHTTTTRKGGK